MKKLMTILCLLCFAGCAYAELYQVPGSYKETTTEVTVEGDTQQISQTTKETKKDGKEDVIKTSILQTHIGTLADPRFGQVRFKCCTLSFIKSQSEQTLKNPFRICRVGKTNFL